ncbi:MAG: choice-of-anchor D domain-containing protein [Oscillochloridaceae bacterium umkhey_bin13]
MGRVLARLLLGLSLLLTSLSWPTPMAHAAVALVVDPSAGDADNNNDGKCSLYEALQAIADRGVYNQCNATGNGPYAINFSNPGPLQLSDPLKDLPNISADVLMLGPVTIVGRPGGTSPIFVVNGGGSLSLTNLTLTKGAPAIRVAIGGTLNAAGVSFIENVATVGDGGAIRSEGALNIAGSLFTGNGADGSDGGGAIWAAGSDPARIAGSIFSGNRALRSGGAIYAIAPLELTDVILDGNLALASDPNNNGTDGDPGDNYDAQGGGAVYLRNNGASPVTASLTRVIMTGNLSLRGNGGALHVAPNSAVTVQDSVLSGNLAGAPGNDRRGGAVANFGGQATIVRSVLLNNLVTGSGGAIANSGDLGLRLANVELTANVATANGGGLFNQDPGGGAAIVNLRNVTLRANSVGGQGAALFNQPGGDLILANTAVLGGCAGGALTSLGHNLDDGTSCGLNRPGDLNATSASFEAPSFNGGPLSPMLTSRPNGSSPLRDAGDPAICANELVDNQDVRGFSRPKGNRCDIGAFELPAPAPLTKLTPLPGTLNFGNVTVGSNQQLSLKLENLGDAPLTLSSAQLSGPAATSFSVMSSIPLTVDPGNVANLTLRCAPTGTPGLRTATLNLSSDDPAQPTLSYSLSCNAVAAPTPGFASNPSAPGPLDFGQVLVGSSRENSLVFSEVGGASLTISGFNLGGVNPGDFSLVGWNSSDTITIPDGSAPATRGLRCTPSAPGLRSATLSMSTNDPQRPTISFDLSCQGVRPQQPPLAPFALGQAGTGASSGPHGLAISPDGQHLYLAAQTGDRLIMLRRSPSGALQIGASYQHNATLPEGTLRLDGPRYVAVSPDGRNVYVTASVSDSVTAFARDATTGLLTLIDTVQQGDSYGCRIRPLPQPPECAGTISSLDNPQGIVVSPDGRHVIVASATGHLTVLSRAENGGLRGLFPSGARFVMSLSRSELAGARGLAISPEGRNLYLAGYTTNQLVVIERNPTNGQLSFTQALSDGAGVEGLDGIFGVAVSPDGQQVYAVSQRANALAIFQRNLAEQGRLSFQGTWYQGDNVLDPQTGATRTLDGLAGALFVVASADGRYVYTSGESANGIAAFARTPEGKLQFVQSIIRVPATGLTTGPFLGAARGLAVDPQGDQLFVASFSDNVALTFGPVNPLPAPEVLLPASAPVGSTALSLRVLGTGFAPGTVVRWAGTDLPTERLGPGELRATLAANLLGSAGNVAITVRNPTPGGGESAALGFMVSPPQTNPIPALASLAPTSLLAGSGPIRISVQGSGFIPTSQVELNGQARPTSYRGPELVEVDLGAADLAQPGARGVRVVNPGPGGGSSAVLTLNVGSPTSPPPPSLISLSPASVVAGAGQGLELSVRGSGFSEGTQGQWNGAARPTRLISAEELVVSLSAADLITPGAGELRVRNPDGQRSNGLSFGIVAPGSNPRPSVDGLSGLSRSGSSLIITLRGTAFVPGATVRWNGVSRAATNVTPTSLQLALQPSEIRSLVLVSVSNPGPGGGESAAILVRIPTVYVPLIRR